MMILNPSFDIKIYLCTGHTDMRKGVNSLALMANSLVNETTFNRAMFVFRGKSADKIKILWWDGQGFCLFYKCFDAGKFIWPNVCEKESIAITTGQLSMLLEGIDWRIPKWSQAPQYVG
jgi:transposase